MLYTCIHVDTYMVAAFSDLASAPSFTACHGRSGCMRLDSVAACGTAELEPMSSCPASAALCTPNLPTKIIPTKMC